MISDEDVNWLEVLPWRREKIKKVAKSAKLSIGDKVKTSDGKSGKIVHIFDAKELEEM